MMHKTVLVGIAMLALVSVWSSPAPAGPPEHKPSPGEIQMFREGMQVLREGIDLQERALKIMCDPLLSGHLAITRIKELTIKSKQLEPGIDMLRGIAENARHPAMKRSALFAISEILEKSGKFVEATRAMGAVLRLGLEGPAKPLGPPRPGEPARKDFPRGPRPEGPMLRTERAPFGPPHLLPGRASEGERAFAPREGREERRGEGLREKDEREEHRGEVKRDKEEREAPRGEAGREREDRERGGPEARPEPRREGGPRPEARALDPRREGDPRLEPRALELRREGGPRPEARPELRREGGPRPDARPELRREGEPRPEGRPELRREGGPSPFGRTEPDRTERPKALPDRVPALPEQLERRMRELDERAAQLELKAKELQQWAEKLENLQRELKGALEAKERGGKEGKEPRREK